MNRKTMLLISTFITVFVLVVTGGVIRAATMPKQPSPSEIEKIYQAREAEYAKLLSEANQRLEQANQQIEALATTTDQSSQPTAEAQIALTAQSALRIAAQVAGRNAVAQTEPQLVNFEQNKAYEVVFDKGKVYVDAATGKVLYNGVPQEITPEEAGKIAVAYLKGGKVYKVEREVFDGTPVYKVTFWAGYIVDVDLQGQVVYVKLIKNQTAQASLSSSDDSSGNSASSGHSQHDDNDDHEEDEDDD